MSLVVDASVVVRWHVPGPGSDHADSLFDRDSPFVAPDLVLPEAANALWVLQRAGALEWEVCAGIVRQLATPFAYLVSAGELVERAVEIARDLDHPVYDCLYLALGEQENAPLVTGDRRLVRKLRGTSWEERVELLRSL